MGYKIKDSGIRKISVPVVCRFGNESKEFADGGILAETAFDTPYEVAEISVADGKIIVCLAETESYPVGGPTNWIGEEAVCQMPQYDKDEEWVKAHIRQFGEEPSFF